MLVERDTNHVACPGFSFQVWTHVHMSWQAWVAWVRVGNFDVWCSIAWGTK